MALSAQLAIAAAGTSGGQATAVPLGFKCPLTGQVMLDPVATCDGRVFERVAIESWFQHGHRTSPVTGIELEAFTVTPQPALHAAIEAFMQHPSTTGKMSYACESNRSRGQQEPTISNAAAVAASKAGANVPALGTIGETKKPDRIPAKSLSTPVLSTVLDLLVATSAPPSDDRDEAGVKRLLHELHFELMRAEKKTAANESPSCIPPKPPKVGKQISSVADHHSTPALCAAQRSIRGSSAAVKAAARGSPGFQRVRVQPASARADVSSCCPGSKTMVCREPSPLRTLKSSGRCSPPRRTLDVTSDVLPERQRLKQLAKTGSPPRSKAAPPTFGCNGEGRPHPSLSRSPSLEATAAVPLRLSSSRGPRRCGSPSDRLMEEGGVKVRSRSASPTRTSRQQQHTLSQAGAQARTMQRTPSEQGAMARGLTASVSSSLLNSARSLAKVGRPASPVDRPASPGAQTCSRQAATSPAAPPKLQRGQTGGSSFKHITTQSPRFGSRSTLGRSQKHNSPSP